MCVSLAPTPNLCSPAPAPGEMGREHGVRGRDVVWAPCSEETGSRASPEVGVQQDRPRHCPLSLAWAQAGLTGSGGSQPGPRVWASTAPGF